MNIYAFKKEVEDRYCSLLHIGANRNPAGKFPLCANMQLYTGIKKQAAKRPVFFKSDV
jgi:hypothetical protein